MRRCVAVCAAGKRGEIAVNEYSQTSVPSIWAVGDVTDRINLTPVALMEGMAVAKTVALNEPTKPDYWAVPSAVFSNPNIATVVGLALPCLPAWLVARKTARLCLILWHSRRDPMACVAGRALGHEGV